MKVLAKRKDERVFQGLSRPEEIGPGNFRFYATWIALAVILSVFVISALYISHIYRTNERNDIAQSAELLAETVDARLSTTSEAVSRYSFSIFHHPNWRLSTRAQGLARRLMESRPEIVEIRNRAHLVRLRIRVRGSQPPRGPEARDAGHAGNPEARS